MVDASLIREIAEKVFPDYIAFCQKIIQTPSEPSREGEVASIYYNEMRKLGYDKVFKDKWGSVAGLIYGTEKGPVIGYNGHMDAVTPGDESLWDDPPYSGIIKKSLVPIRNSDKFETAEAIHGRGASDMKCSGAAQVYTGAILHELRERGYPIKGTFMVQQVVLEENGEAMGTIKLLEYLRDNGCPVPDAVVCGEPTGLNLCLGHRGRMELKVTVYGKSCHGSCPWEGINAMSKAAPLITAIDKAIANNGFADKELGHSGIALTMLKVEPCELCIVPNKVIMVYDRRLVPNETPEGAVKEIQDIIDRMASEDPEFKAEVEANTNLRFSYTGEQDVIKSQKEVCKMSREHPFVKACALALDDAGIQYEYTYLTGSTDIPPVIWRLHKPALLFSGAQMNGVHQPNEKARTDYLKESLIGNASIFFRAVELPDNAFTC